MIGHREAKLALIPPIIQGHEESFSTIGVPGEFVNYPYN